MILIDSLYVNRSGSKLLFNYLVQNLIETNSDIFYLIDSRNESDFSMIPSSNKIILKANIFARFSFYLFNKKKFKKIFCFSGVPPLVKSRNVTYYNYFHNVVLITDRYKNILLFLKYYYLKLFKKNVNFWIVQTNYTSNLIINKIKINRNNVLILPFFLDHKPSNRLNASKYNFIYVSDAYEHKNHQRLFEAFFNLSKIYPEINLTVTIDKKKSKYIKLIELFKLKGLHIDNIGFNSNIDIEHLYEKFSCLIFPSLNESLGLGLVEASQLGMSIIASDLQYVHNTISTKYLFDPFSISSIETSVINYLSDKSPEPAFLKLENNLNKIIELIQQESN